MKVVFSPEAEEQLAALYNYIADATSPDIAQRYTETIVAYCESMKTFPLRGVMRDDVRHGLRVTNYKKRMVIAFAVDTIAGQVAILGLFYGGQNYETLCRTVWTAISLFWASDVWSSPPGTINLTESGQRFKKKIHRE